MSPSDPTVVDPDPEPESVPVPLISKVATLAAILLPLLGLVAAIILLWGWGVTWVDLGLLVGFYLLTAVGITVGFHRLFVHRSFETYTAIKVVLAALGSMAVQGPLFLTVGALSTGPSAVRRMRWLPAALAGVCALAAVYFPIVGNEPQWGMVAVLAMFGAAFGAWSASLIGVSTPSNRLKRFTQAIEAGQILLMVDVPRSRVDEIEERLQALHPEAHLEGVEPDIPAFP